MTCHDLLLLGRGAPLALVLERDVVAHEREHLDLLVVGYSLVVN